jgi:hypothetical protein
MAYGFCPHCGAEVESRTRGGRNANDVCLAGHVYPSAFTISHAMSGWVQLVRAAFGIIGSELELYADTTAALTREQARDLANRCKRMLSAIPLTRTDHGTPAVAAPVEGRWPADPRC